MVEVKVLEMQSWSNNLKTITFTISAEMHLKFRTQPFTHYSLDILTDTLPDIDAGYYNLLSWSINLKPIIWALMISEMILINVIGVKTPKILNRAVKIHP
jgi:hypothetical protein